MNNCRFKPAIFVYFYSNGNYKQKTCYKARYVSNERMLQGGILNYNYKRMNNYRFIPAVFVCFILFKWKLQKNMF